MEVKTYSKRVFIYLEMLTTSEKQSILKKDVTE